MRGGRGGGRAWALAALLVAAGPAAADAQVFMASRPHPPFTVGPLFVRASVGSSLGPVEVDVLWSVVVPPTRAGADVEQDLFLLWPSAVRPVPGLGPPDAALARYVRERGFDVIEEGRVALLAENLYADGPAAVPERGGAPFVTFVRGSSPLGLSAPATYVRLPWSPRFVNRTWIMDLRLTVPGLVRAKASSWVEDVFWGRRFLVSVSFNDVRHRAVFPLYFENRDRVVRLADDPSQLLINLAEVDRLKVDEVFPPNSSRRLSESLETTEVVSLFLDRSEGLTPQVLTVQFAYFSGVQAWAPVIIPVLFFLLGNVAGGVLRTLAEKASRRLAGRVEFGRPKAERERQTGVLLARETVAKLVPGETTYADVLRLCGADVEESQRLHTPDRRTLVYRGRRLVPRRRQVFGWLATVKHWDVEDHEVVIELEQDRVKDVQARIRRARLTTPAPA
ncbi:MAG TPA: hypothetical protein VFX28_18065 [Methylomirabilota bacterium]|nr:hypothetical protein [Methylomirabilota bacterium]